MKRFLILMMFLLLLSGSLLPYPAVASDLKQAIAGQNPPLTLRLKDLDQSWRRMSLGGESDSLGSIPFIGPLLQALGSNAYYTQGQTIVLGNETFLVAYRITGMGSNLALLRSASAALPTSKQVEPTPRKEEGLTPNTPLSLSLINFRTISSLNDIQPFNLKQEIENWQRLRSNATEFKTNPQ